MSMSVVSPEQPFPRRESWPAVITVIAWRDPVVERAAGSVPTVSDDALTWWTPTLGPSAVLLARHLASYATEGPTRWPLTDLAASLGVKTAVLERTLDRLVRFGVVTRHASTAAVRLALAPLTARQRDQLPPYLAEAYEQR